ncbi:hypothetical protein G6F56_004037 [Rhizopus delemar]|nr:hypothetical protein G6F56_004037 [Rhizopus delemar]
MPANTIFDSSIDFESSSLLQGDGQVGFLSGHQSSAAIREESNNTLNNWRKSSHDINNPPDNDLSSSIILSLAPSSSSSSSFTGKRSSSDAENTHPTKKTKLEDEDCVLFGPIPTSISFSPVPHRSNDLLMDDEAIFEELEKITSNDNDTFSPISPPSSPILSHIAHDFELDDDFILFP